MSELNAESLMHKHGAVAVIVHKDQLSRKEKDVVRNSGLVKPMGDHYVLLIQEEIDENDALALASFEEYEDDQRVEVTTVHDGSPVFVPQAEPKQDNGPTMADLEKLTVAQLRDLADKEALDVSDLKLKADLLGRISAHLSIDL